MDKKTFLTLVYIGTLLPLLYLASNYLGRGLLGVALGNVLLLMIISIISGSASSSKKRNLLWFLIGAGLLVAGANVLIHNQNINKIADNNLIENTSQKNELLSGNILSGEVSAITMPREDMSYEVVTDPTTNENLNTGANNDTTPIYESQSIENIDLSTKAISSLPSGILSYTDIIPYLIITNDLIKRGSANPIFANISSNNPLYNSFAIASSRNMIGNNINPTSKVSCNTYLVLKGIAQGRKVTYPAGSPFAAYRAEAVRRGIVNGCSDGQFVTKEKL